MNGIDLYIFLALLGACSVAGSCVFYLYRKVGAQNYAMQAETEKLKMQYEAELMREKELKHKLIALKQQVIETRKDFNASQSQEDVIFEETDNLEDPNAIDIKETIALLEMAQAQLDEDLEVDKRNTCSKVSQEADISTNTLTPLASFARKFSSPNFIRPEQDSAVGNNFNSSAQSIVPK